MSSQFFYEQPMCGHLGASEGRKVDAARVYSAILGGERQEVPTRTV
jgi:hypothetical protein